MIAQRKRILWVAVTVGIVVLSIILIAYITFLDKQNVAQARGFPTQKITLEMPLRAYSRISSSGSKITRYEWGVLSPTHKVQEYNLFEDYWTFEDENVIVDTDFLIENINSSNVLVKGNACEIIPLDYVSNRVSHVSLYSVSSRKDKQTELLNFAAQEIEVLQKIAFAKETETTVKTPATLETEEKWVLRLHVKDMENLYYYAADRLCRTTEGAWYFMATANDVRCAVPAGIAEKFEMAVQRI